MNVKILEHVTEDQQFSYPVLGLGNFDGLHVGHQSILKKVAERATEKHGTPIVFTFEPHPVKVLFPNRPLELLSSYEEKLDLIEKCGIKIIICLKFTEEFAQQSPREFVKKFLVDRLKIKEVFVGPNYGFGKDRSGNVDTLLKFGEEYGFLVNIVPSVEIRSQIVSSSLIRQLLKKGDVEKVLPLLGRPYLLEGDVVKGDMRGRTMGYPTANILPSEKLVPKDGVYSVNVQIHQDQLPGIVYIGTQPTFQKTKRQIEVHLFNFSNELYGEHLKVYFYGLVRDDMKFPDRKALIHQIEKDILEAKNILRSNLIVC